MTRQEQFESSPTGRAVISGGLLFVLLAIAVANLPTSYIQIKLNTVVQPVRDGLGLDQDWSVFAPEPRRQTFELGARITYGDGSTDVWTVPTGDPFLAEYRVYHWQKWSEYARSDTKPALWEPLAAWIARTYDRPNRHPVDVTLVRRWYDINPPGAHPNRGPLNEYAYFSLKVTDAVLKGDSGCARFWMDGAGSGSSRSRHRRSASFGSRTACSRCSGPSRLRRI